MTCDFYHQANKSVQSLQAYAPGKPISELERELGIDNITKLASNENPLGCSKKALEAARKALEDISLYPDGNGFALKTALANKYGLQASQLILGNGSNDILELVARAYLNEQSEAIFSQYAFAVYPIAVQAVGAKACISPVKDWGHDLSAMLALVTDKTKVIFIANPNNPTGTWLGEGELRQFLEQVPDHILVVLDEAYCEYVEESEYPDGLAFLAEFENILVTRTFSKAYGLAGLRVGYGVASETIIDILNRVRQPFNVNAPALAAAEAALSDGAFLSESRELNRKGLCFFMKSLGIRGLNAIPSVGNFIAIDFGERAQLVNDELLKKGIIVRSLIPYQMPNFLRVTIGTEQENILFFEKIDEIGLA